jgi:hypothetical protein
VKVTEVNKDAVTVTELRKGGKTTDANVTKTLPLGAAAVFDVFQAVRREFAEGDVIRLTRNRRANEGQKQLNNGSRFTIHGFDEQGHLRLGDGLLLDPEWGFFDHGSVVTSYSSQGSTVDRCFVAQSSLSFTASSPRQANVSGTRATKSVEFFTDSKAGLREAIASERPNRMAMDVGTDTQAKAETSPTPSRRRQMTMRISQLAARAKSLAEIGVRKLAQILPRRPVVSHEMGRG